MRKRADTELAVSAEAVTAAEPAAEPAALAAAEPSPPPSPAALADAETAAEAFSFLKKCFPAPSA